MAKRQHGFLKDGRQALEGKLNLSKDAVEALRKDSRFVAPFTHPQFFFFYMFLFIRDSFIGLLNGFFSKGGET